MQNHGTRGARDLAEAGAPPKGEHSPSQHGRWDQAAAAMGRFVEVDKTTSGVDIWTSCRPWRPGTGQESGACEGPTQKVRHRGRLRGGQRCLRLAS